MYHYLAAVALILALLLGWIVVQQIARMFAARHPGLGAYREEGGCGSGRCGSCAGDACRSGDGRRGMGDEG